jgi:hypothetical protein
MSGFARPLRLAILMTMMRSALFPLLMGVALALVSLVLLFDIAASLSLLVYLAIVPVGMALAVSAAIPRLRARTHPLPAVLTASASYWTGVLAGHAAAFALAFSAELGTAIVVANLEWAAVVSGTTAGLVALVMSGVHVTRSRIATR